MPHTAYIVEAVRTATGKKKGACGVRGERRAAPAARRASSERTPLCSRPPRGCRRRRGRVRASGRAMRLSGCVGCVSCIWDPRKLRTAAGVRARGPGGALPPLARPKGHGWMHTSACSAAPTGARRGFGARKGRGMVSPDTAGRARRPRWGSSRWGAAGSTARAAPGGSWGAAAAEGGGRSQRRKGAARATRARVAAAYNHECLTAPPDTRETPTNTPTRTRCCACHDSTGRLSNIHPADLGAKVVDALLDRTGVDPALVDDVVFGCVSQVGRGGSPCSAVRARAGGGATQNCQRGSVTETEQRFACSHTA